MRQIAVITAIAGALLCSIAHECSAQQLSGADQGMLPYRSYEGGDIDSVSTVNGNITLHIPLLAYPQRGGRLQVSFSLVYQNPRLQPWAGRCVNHVCQLTGYNLVYGQPNLLAAPQAINPVADFVPVVQAVPRGTGCCPNEIQYYTATDADGATHDLGQTSENNFNNYIAVDTSGFLFTPQSPNETSGYGVLTNRQGVSYTTTASSAQFQDTNGNLITRTSTGWTDTMGRTIPSPTTTTSTTDLSHCPSTATTATIWSPPGPNGTTLQYKYCWATISSVFTTPQCSSNCQQTGHTRQNEIVGIVLPNLTTWSFAFDNYGELTTITLPTGGTISYNWAFVSGQCYGPQYIDPGSGVDTFLWPYGRAVTSRTVNDETGSHTWNYAVNSTFTQTIVTDPLGNDTVHNNTQLGNTCSIYETELDRYSGSHTNGTLLQKTVTNYSYSPGGGSVGFGAIVLSVVPTSITTTDETSGMVSGVTKTYDSGISIYSATWGGVALYGDVLTENDYDFGSGSLGNLLRKTTTQYMALSGPNASQYLATNQLSLPYTVQVTNGAGTQLSLTQYNYDETARASSGLTSSNQFNSNPPSQNFRGNNTSVEHWLNTFNSTDFSCPNGFNGNSKPQIWTRKTYFDDGMLNTSADPCGNTTTYAYNLTYWGTLPTTVTNALNQSTTNAYDFNTGLLTSTTDPNNQTTNYGPYDSMWRLTQVNYPDGGQDTITHQETTTPFTATLTTNISSILNKVQTNVFDGLGRVSQTQLTSDPQGTTYTLTTYDPLGRPYQVYNPTRCNPITTNCGESTWGITTYAYDALGRTTSVTEQDGSVVATAYNLAGPSNTVCTQVMDEAGKSRKSCVDGLGRLLQVFEDPSGLNYETDYSYDALDNLLSVNQKGNDPNSADWRTRTFAYDSLSRLLSANNPESGTITYAYDPSGNLTTKTAPGPNNTTNAVTAYSYDALNRLLQKSYSGGNATSTVSYGYDGTAPSGCTPPTVVSPTGSGIPISPANIIGRRSGMCDASGATAWIYDSMGRPTIEERKLNGATKNMAYVYNRDGETYGLWYASDNAVNTQVTAAGRPFGVTDEIASYVFPNVSYTPNGALTSFGYVPSGGGQVTTQNFYSPRLQLVATYNIFNSDAPSYPLFFSRCYDYHLKNGGTFGNSNANCVFSASATGDNGNIYQITNNLDGNRTQNFLYDSLNRITQAYTNGSNWGQTFSPLATAPGVQPTTSGIDPWGNLTNVSGVTGKTNSGTTFSCPANTNNRLTTCSMNYDGAGNMISNGSATYTYDDENRITTTAGYTYVYDGDGKRVIKCAGTYPSCSSGTMYWALPGSDTMTESDLSGNINAEYIYFQGMRVARRDVPSNVVHFNLNDQLGTARQVLQLVNATTATVEEDADYYPYGGEIVVSGSSAATRYKFTGKERDSESGLDNFGARYYGSTLGRFVQVDPVVITPERKVDPQQLNRYAYGRNSPLRFIDPTGEILQLSGDLAADTAAICEIVGSDNCSRITINEKNNTVSFDTTGLDLSANEGATLINQLVTSSNTYGFALSDTANTAGGPMKLTNDAISNLDNQPDDRYGNGKTATDLPSKGVADQVTINPNTAHFKDSEGRSVSIPSLAFHELAEAYGKIDGGKAYGDFQNISVVNGTTLQVGPPQQGAHNQAVQRELNLREQRPNLQNSGRAGDQLIRDPHN